MILEAILMALLHSLWQAGILAAALWIALRLTPSRRTTLRYAMALGAMLALVVAALVTGAIYALPERLAATVTASHAGAAFASAPAATSANAPSHSWTTPDASPLVPLEWRQALLIGWGIGVVLMVLRMGMSLRGWRVVANEARAVDEDLSGMLERWRLRMGIGRTVRMGIAEGLVTACVVGLIRPMVLIPAGLAGNLPAGQMAMVVIHELAHIRRWDAIINVLQMLIEALLFFNPAVWWISRQIRLEREACCDAWAVRLLESPVDYARLLADCAAYGLPRTAMAMGSDDRQLLSRVKRILCPQARPEVKLPWYSLASVSVAGVFLLAAAGAGTAWAVEKVLTPQERIEQVKAAEKEFAGEKVSDPSKAPSVEVTMTVRTWDGKPLPKDHSLDISQQGGLKSARVGDDGVCICKVPPQRMSVGLYAPGYATKLVPEFMPKEDEPVEIVLMPDRQITVKFVDETGAAVDGVAVKSWLRMASGGPYLPDRRSSANGLIKMPGGEIPVVMRCTRPGFMFKAMELAPNGPAEQTVILKRSHACTGRVVDQNGKPIAGASLRLIGRKGQDEFFEMPHTETVGELLATADSEGRFTLDTLADGDLCALCVQAKGYSPEIQRGVTAGRKDMAITLGPSRVIKGKVLGDLSQLKGNWQTGNKPAVFYSTQFDEEHCGYGGQPAFVSADGSFEICDLPPCRVTIDNAVPSDIDMKALGAAGKTVVDLRPASTRGTPTRRVTFHLQVPEGNPTPTGRLTVQCFREGTSQFTESDLEIDAKGEASMDAPVPSRVSITGTSVPGYALEDLYGFEVAEGEGSTIAPVKAMPAGTIFGRLLDCSGEPMDRSELWLVVIQRGDPSVMFDVNKVNRQLKQDGSGRFAVGPLPLGGRYMLVATTGRLEDRMIVASEPLEIDAKSPVRQIEMSFGKGRDVTVELVDEAGRPVESEVSLDHRLVDVTGDCSWGSGGIRAKTDANGRLILPSVTRAKHLAPSIHVRPGDHTIGVIRPLGPEETTVRIVLPAGRKVSGQLVDAQTGEPIAGRQVQLHKDDASVGSYPEMIEVTTDSDGRFVLGCLEPQVYRMTSERFYWLNTEQIRIDGRIPDAGIIKVRQLQRQ